MRDNQHLTQEQSLQLRLTPQQLRYVRLLEMNAAELDEAVEREMEANPALEEVAPVAVAPAVEGGMQGLTRPRRGSYEEDTPQYVIPDDEPSMYDTLDEQLASLPLEDDVARAARYIVASLDGNGYLRRDLPLLLDDMAINHGIHVDVETLGRALKAVQSLEPHGVGARSLQETLELQLEAMPASQVRDDALRMVREQFEAFTMRHYSRLASTLGLDADRVREASALIASLNPKPGASVGGGMPEVARAIVPDIIIDRENDGSFSISLNNRYPELAIQQSFAQAVAEMEAGARERASREGGREYVMTNYNDARDFIRVLSQRQKTLVQVMTAILSLQRDYFATEDVYALRPMMIKDIAALTGLDFSVISRATAGKYVVTPWGTFPLRFFFSDSKGSDKSDKVSGEGNADRGKMRGERTEDSLEGADGGETAPGAVITNRKIEARIAQLVEEEDKRHPMSDEKLRRAMAESGFDLSRRTVAKYRDRIGIPVARLRRLPD